MYHVIADPPAGRPVSGALRLRATPSPRQIGWLAAPRLPWRDAAGRLRPLAASALRLPAHPIVVTFDDGYHSQFATAAPVPPRATAGPACSISRCGTRRDSWGLSDEQVRLLIADGWELAAHTLTHPDLTKVDAADLEHEVAGSRAELRSAVRRARSTSSVTRRGGSTTRWSPCGASCRVPRCDDDRARVSPRPATCSGSTACGSTGATGVAGLAAKLHAAGA